MTVEYDYDEIKLKLETWNIFYCTTAPCTAAAADHKRVQNRGSSPAKSHVTQKLWTSSLITMRHVKQISGVSHPIRVQYYVNVLISL